MILPAPGVFHKILQFPSHFPWKDFCQNIPVDNPEIRPHFPLRLFPLSHAVFPGYPPFFRSITAKTNILSYFSLKNDLRISHLTLPPDGDPVRRKEHNK